MTFTTPTPDTIAARRAWLRRLAVKYLETGDASLRAMAAAVMRLLDEREVRA